MKKKLPPGQLPRRRRKVSEYGMQLREKQKVKRFYGLFEKQFKRYFEIASRRKGITGEILLVLLEQRLDNVVFRMGLVESRSVARQLVGHGHVLVDGKKVTIPSYQIKPGQTVTLAAKALKLESVKQAMTDKSRKIPAWLKRKAVVGKMARLPEREEVDTDIDEHLIIEFYSR